MGLTRIIHEAFADRSDPFAFANLVLATEAPKYGIAAPPVITPETPFEVQRWSRARVLAAIAAVAAASKIQHDDGVPPRRFGGRLIYANVGADRLVLVDGRHRSWMASESHEVVVLQMGMIADRYYGRLADEYDAVRERTPIWALEHAAVGEMVTRGPVLDCPVGTGRFLSIYRAKGLDYVGADASCEMLDKARAKDRSMVAFHASILALPFDDKEFGTAVCSRMLNWFYPENMALAMAEVRRVAHEIVVSVRIGKQGHHSTQENYTHSAADFAAACEGLETTGKRVIASGGDGEFAIYKLEAR